MKSVRLLLAMPALFAVACATAPLTEPSRSPVAAHRSPITAELEAAKHEIESRAATPAQQVRGDVEAIASIPIPTHPSIGKAITLFSNQLKPGVQDSLLRSAKYRAMFDRVLAEYKLPKALAYLPVIESAYLPTLTSRAGARGIWQFMDETARDYGLRVDWWVDERADPERSTRAAAAFIADLYRQFNDWPLTLAAYNAGPGRVKRALAANGAQTFWELLDRGILPAETRGYVPTFFATLSIAADPAAYGFQTADPVSTDVRRVEVPGPVSLAWLAQVAGVDERTLLDLNPAYRRGIVPPGRSAVVLPAEAATTIASRADTLRNDDPMISICTFTLREGDSIRRIAASIGATADTLSAMNGGRRARTGDTIYLPVRSRDLGALLAGETYYAVKKGDTIYSIAKRFDLSVAELRELNQLSSKRKIRTGDKLRVSAPRALTAGGM
jgi:membrane-bound lytic murein transglycosylase D